jgi:hypothetical protein
MRAIKAKAIASFHVTSVLTNATRNLVATSNTFVTGRVAANVVNDPNAGAASKAMRGGVIITKKRIANTIAGASFPGM